MTKIKKAQEEILKANTNEDIIKFRNGISTDLEDFVYYNDDLNCIEDSILQDTSKIIDSDLNDDTELKINKMKSIDNIEKAKKILVIESIAMFKERLVNEIKEQEDLINDLYFNTLVHPLSAIDNLNPNQSYLTTLDGKKSELTYPPYIVNHKFLGPQKRDPLVLLNYYALACL